MEGAVNQKHHFSFTRISEPSENEELEHLNPPSICTVGPPAYG